jgi:hypothetical protein
MKDGLFTQNPEYHGISEIKMHTTIYWEVPKGADPKTYMELLQRLTKEEALKLACDFGDSEFEVNE